LKGDEMQTAFNRAISLRIAAAATAALLAFTLGGCTATPKPPDQQSPTAQASTDRPSPAFVPVLERYTDSMLNAGAPSVFIQIKSRIGEWSKAAGVRSLENREPVQLTDQVHIGDVTNAMVAVSVMKLVEEGKVRLDDPITQYVPEFETLAHPPGPVSVRSLLNHQSGMPDYWETLLATTPMREVLDKRLSHEERLAVSATRPWVRQGVFKYSGSNYAALALLVERLRGRGIGEVLHTDIAAPLGLQDTLMSGTDPGPQKMVHGYVLLGGKQADATLPAIHAGAADHGMISTVPDLNTFFAALAQGKLLKASSVVEMYTLNQVNKEEEYGLGVQQRYDACSNNYYFGHVGDVPGYATVAFTSTDGSRQVAMAVALPPASPPPGFNQLVLGMLDAALEALNHAC
jgi:D-alanyl-D-alanine carboxypeptidase